MSAISLARSTYLLPLAAASSSPAWPVRARARSRERSRRRLAFPSSVSTSIAGIPAGFGCPRTSSARSSAPCLLARSGLLTATSHLISDSSARTLSCTSTRRGGSAHGARSYAGFAGLAVFGRPTAAMIRPGDGCGTNGGWFGASGEAGTRSANESLRLRRSAEGMWRFTFCVRRGRRESSWIVPRLTVLSRHRKVSVERRR